MSTAHAAVVRAIVAIRNAEDAMAEIAEADAEYWKQAADSAEQLHAVYRMWWPVHMQLKLEEQAKEEARG